MNRGSGSNRHKVPGASVQFGTAVLEFHIHFNHKVVFLLRRLLEEELFPDGDLLGCDGLKFDRGVRLSGRRKLGKRGRPELAGFNDRADRGALCRIQDKPFPFFGHLPEQDRFLDAAAAICKAQLDIRIMKRLYFLRKTGNRFGSFRRCSWSSERR